MDFQFDATADGRRLKFLNVIDEHSRLCLAIRVGRRCKSKDVVAVLEAHQPLPSPSVHPQRQRAPIHRARPQALEREQRHHHDLHRTRVTVAERVCRVVQQPVQG
jgi:hypothetical protein